MRHTTTVLVSGSKTERITNQRTKNCKIKVITISGREKERSKGGGLPKKIFKVL